MSKEELFIKKHKDKKMERRMNNIIKERFIHQGAMTTTIERRNNDRKGRHKLEI